MVKQEKMKNKLAELRKEVEKKNKKCSRSEN